MFDVAESLLFATMAEVAATAPVGQRSAWLSDLEYQLRLHAVAGASLAVPLGEWCDGHEEEFLALLIEAGQRLAARGRVTAAEAVTWTVLDGTPVIWRGHDAIATGPAVAVADALAAVIRGTHPQAPPGQEWYFGHPGGARTIQVRGRQ